MARILGLFSQPVICAVRRLLAVLAGPAAALDLSSLNNKDAVAGLKAALDKGTQVAVQRLGARTASSATTGSKSRCPNRCRRSKAACAPSAWAGRPTNWCCA